MPPCVGPNLPHTAVHTCTSDLLLTASHHALQPHLGHWPVWASPACATPRPAHVRAWALPAPLAVAHASQLSEPIKPIDPSRRSTPAAARPILSRSFCSKQILMLSPDCSITTRPHLLNRNSPTYSRFLQIFVRILSPLDQHNAGLRTA